MGALTNFEVQGDALSPSIRKSLHSFGVRAWGVYGSSKYDYLPLGAVS